MLKRRLAVRVLAVLAVLMAASFSGLLVGTPAVRADHTTVQWNAENPVTGTTGVNEENPVVLSDHQGYLYFIYIAPSSGIQADVAVAKYHVTPLGSLAFVFQRTVNPTLGSVDQTEILSAAMDHNGYIYVAWTESSGFTGGLGKEAMVTRSTDGGNTWAQTTAADPVNSYGDDYSPIVAAAADGTISVVRLVSWGGLTNVAYARSTNQGTTFSGFVNITNQGAPYAAYWPDMAVDSHGRIYVVYEYWNVPASVYTLNYTWSDGGASWAAPHPMTTNQAVPSYVPKIVVDANDVVHVVFYSWKQSPAGTNTMQYRRSTDRGATWSPQIAVNQGLQIVNTFPSIAVTGSTVLVVGVYGAGYSYAVSADGGLSFYPEEDQAIANGPFNQREAVDENGTIWSVYQYNNLATTSLDIGVASWHAPPSVPVITEVTPGTGQLTVTWTGSPEADVVEYRVYRSLDGTNYQIVGTVGSGTTSFTDTPLVNGTYWYQVDAVDAVGLASHLSQPWYGVVGMSTQDLINQLEGEIAGLQSQLNSSDANLTAARAQVTSLQTALTNLQNSQSTANTATAAQLAQLQTELTNLQNQLNNLQSQQATQTISYANLAFEVIVVVLLVVLLLNQMRRPKAPRIVMAEPAQVPKKPEDDL